MIYIDTSVALAQLLAEDRRPPRSLWSEPLISSRLLEYELWNRVNTRNLSESHGDAARRLLEGVAMLEMITPVLARALEPFPAPIRTLDALHLASVEFLRGEGVDMHLASYDQRQLTIAKRLGIPIHDI